MFKLQSALLATLLLIACAIGLAQEKVPAPAALGSVQVQLPEGDLRLSFVESPEGMALLLHAGDSHVRARRLFLGDGKVAVAYEATNNGVHSQGRWLPNAAAFDFKHPPVIEVSRQHLKPWGEQAGEVYVRVQKLKFKVVE